MILDMGKKSLQILRSAAAALLIGVIVGAIDAVFGRGLLAITDFRTEHFKYLIPFLPVAGLLIVWLYRSFSELSQKGMTLILETGQGRRDDIPLLLAPLVLVTTWITHLFGGSAGREGVAVQIGAVVSYRVEQKFHLCDNEKKMLIIGMAAGFGGLFQTPLAAAFFAVEVITAGWMEYESLGCALLSAYTASLTSHFLGLEKFAVPVKENLKLTDMRVVLLVLVLGIVFGLTGRLFASLLKWAKEKMAKTFTNPYIRIGLISILLVILLVLLHMGRYSGLGTNLIDAAFHSGTIHSYDWIVKLILTVLTLCIGFQGSIPWHRSRKPAWTSGSGLCHTGICGSLWWSNQYTDRTDVDWNGNIWRAECTGICDRLQCGLYCKWKSFHLHGTAACRGDKKKRVSIKWDR